MLRVVVCRRVDYWIFVVKSLDQMQQLMDASEK